MKYFLNSKVLTNEYGSLRVFGVTGPTVTVEDVSEDREIVEQVIRFLNLSNLPEENLVNFLTDYIDEISTVRT